MNILILGNGGREHALAWCCSCDARVDHIWVAPGNAGVDREQRCATVDIDPLDTVALIDFIHKQKIDMTIVGPEAPLVQGVVDRLQEAGCAVFGPCQEAARLEGSKSYAKSFMAKHGIPTASYAVFEDANAAREYLRTQPLPIVIKADGLAAGKGVVVAQTEAEAESALHSMLEDQRFGSAGARVVIESFLEGEEASFIVVVDGKHALPLATSQDHKRIFEGDLGPNTGGMGAYSPAPVVTAEVHQRVMDRIIMPTIQAMADAGHPYTGFLYAGLMINAQGDPYVVEFNCRMGDPETQPILMRLESSLPELIQAALDKRLDEYAITWSNDVALGIVLAAPGYPDQPVIGQPADRLTQDAQANCKIFWAGLKSTSTGIITSGGRVACVTALGHDVASAQQTALAYIDKLGPTGLHFRRDIGYRAIKRTI